jgi:hypothetical protein
MAKMAKDEAAARLAKLAQLIELGRDLHDKLGAVLEEANEIAGGGNGIAAAVKDAEETFDRLWCERYAAGELGRYVWTYSKDKPNLKRLVRTLGLPEVKARMFRFMLNEEPFITRNRHTFALFVSGINAYAEAGVPAPGSDFALEAPTVADCKHTPRCQSDQEHTALRLAELRS